MSASGLRDQLVMLCGAMLIACSEAPAATPAASTAGASGAGGMAVAGAAGTLPTAGDTNSAGSLTGGSGGELSQAGTTAAGTAGQAGQGGAGGAPLDPGPNVDSGDPQLYRVMFSADEADPAANLALATQNAYLDTRVESLGKLVVYLHGAGEPTSCGGGALAELVAGWGFHWLAPCYVSNYGIVNCGADIGGCRLEAFEGVDHHDFIDIGPPNSIEGRVVAGLMHLQNENPQGDWQYYLEGGKPRWSRIVIAGASHGASTAGLVGIHRQVDRVVMLAGPLDTNQAWLEQTPLTPIAGYFGFTHTLDDQHSGHLAAFTTLGVPGTPTSVDAATPPYGNSQRLITSRDTSNGHGAVSDGNITDYHPVWAYMFGH